MTKNIYKTKKTHITQINLSACLSSFHRRSPWLGITCAWLGLSMINHILFLFFFTRSHHFRSKAYQRISNALFFILSNEEDVTLLHFADAEEPFCNMSSGDARLFKLLGLPKYHHRSTDCVVEMICLFSVWKICLDAKCRRRSPAWCPAACKCS